VYRSHVVYIRATGTHCGVCLRNDILCRVVR